MLIHSDKLQNSPMTPPGNSGQARDTTWQLWSGSWHHLVTLVWPTTPLG